MNKKQDFKGLIIFDHDGTLVNTSIARYELFSGIKDLVQGLQSLGFDLAVWTARPKSSAQEILSKLGIAHFFTQFYGSGDGFNKPHPQGLEYLAGELDKDLVLHIGDSQSDIDGALAFKIEVIAACWNDPSAAKHFTLKTPHVALNVNECIKIIEEKFKIKFNQ